MVFLRHWYPMLFAVAMLSPSAVGQVVCGPRGCQPQWRPSTPGHHNLYPPGQPHAPAPTGSDLRPASRAFPSIVRVGMGSSRGSGTVVAQRDGHSYILTCYHLIRGERGQPHVTLHDGRQVPAEIVEGDAPNDWLVLRTPALDVPVVRIDFDRDIQPGEPVAAYGFPGNSGLRGSSGQVTGYASSSRGGRPEMIETSCTVSSGMSGGPIICSRGTLVGLITGGGRRYGMGPAFPRLRIIGRILFGPRGQPVARPSPPPSADPRPETHPLPGDVATPEPPIENILTGRLVAIEERLDLVGSRLDSLEAAATAAPTVGPAGPPGPAGPRGEPGADGTPGATQQIDLDALAAAVAERLPPIRFQTKLDGKVIEETEVYLGGTLPLNLVPFSKWQKEVNP